MSLKTVFQSMKKEGFVVKRLDEFLITNNSSDNDRAVNVNSPSQIGKCPRARFYARLGYPRNSGVDPRSIRILDNGTYTHIRLQEYLSEAGILDMEEVPVINEEFNIQGHTDGIINIGNDEKAILELKTINSRNYGLLKDAKEEHKKQGLTYLYCIEQRRLKLHSKYKNKGSFLLAKKSRYKKYAERYQHLEDGNRYSREEKIKYQCDLLNKLDTLLFDLKKPLTKVVFVYENKDTQELKEFTINSGDYSNDVLIKDILSECHYVNECVLNNELPERCSKSKSDNACRWCEYSLECWN